MLAVAESCLRFRCPVSDADEIRQLVQSVYRPVNVLTTPKGPTVPELADAGVARISVGGAFYFASLAALADAAKEWREHGMHDFWAKPAQGIGLAHQAFGKK